MPYNQSAQVPDYLKITQIHHRYASALTALRALFASSTLGDSITLRVSSILGASSAQVL